MTKKEESGITWFCLDCTMRTNHCSFPFTLNDNHDLVNVNMSDSMGIIDHLPSEDILDETSQYPCFTHFSDSDDGEIASPELLSSKYHTISEFQSLDLGGRFNIFHSNVNGLESKFDALSTFLTCSTSFPDVIGITETSEQRDTSFISNVSLQGHRLYHTPTNSAKGGCCIYVNDSFDVFERVDLRVQNDHFQSTWAEIKKKKHCGGLYV